MLSRLTQLECCARSFEQGSSTGDLVYHLLALIGFCRRAGLSSQEEVHVAARECMVRDSFASVIEALEKFVPTITFDSWDVESLSEEGLVSLYEDRDSAELVFHQLCKLDVGQMTYTPCTGVLAQLRKALDLIDNRILLRKDLVLRLREIGELEPVECTDTDWFWWLPGERHDCYLPAHKRDEFQSLFVSGGLPEFKRHVSNCQYCREAVAEIQAECLESD